MRGCSRTVSKRGWSLCHHGRFLNTRPKSIERAYCRQTSKRALPSSRPLPSDGSATWGRKVVSSVCTHLGLLRRSKSCKRSSALSPIKLSRLRRNFWPQNKSVRTDCVSCRRGRHVGSKSDALQKAACRLQELLNQLWTC